jgi:NAD(P)-dependent dehydrogenase (short-subunit alcohol dehydrogenase family)
MTNLIGKVAIITGASSGIGWEVAKNLDATGPRIDSSYDGASIGAGDVMSSLGCTA